MAGHTAPINTTTCPEIKTYLRPKISLNPPAMEKDTAEATDHPPGIQTIFAVSPSEAPICSKIPDGRTRTMEIAAT